jgi:hypothetical protein
MAALNSLANFEGTSHHIIKSSFGKFKVIEELKILLNSKIDNDLKRSVIKAMGHVNQIEIETLLLEIMNSSNADLQLTCLDLLQTSNNKELAEYLANFLKSKNHAVRVRTALLLIKFKEFRAAAQKTLAMMTSAKNKKTMIAVLDNLHYFEDKKLILWARDMLGSNDKTIKEAALFAMAGIREVKAMEEISDLLIDGNKSVMNRLKENADNYDLSLKSLFGAKLIKSAFKNQFVKSAKIDDYSKYLHYLDKKRLSRLCVIFKILKLDAQKYYMQSMIQEKNKFINLVK